LSYDVRNRVRYDLSSATEPARANGKRSAIRAPIEHIFAYQEDKMGLFIRTIGLARARTKIGLANLVYNMRRLLWLETAASAA
jgi:transposase, IS5 family